MQIFAGLSVDKQVLFGLSGDEPVLFGSFKNVNQS